MTLDFATIRVSALRVILTCPGIIGDYGSFVCVRATADSAAQISSAQYDGTRLRTDRGAFFLVGAAGNSIAANEGRCVCMLQGLGAGNRLLLFYLTKWGVFHKQIYIFGNKIPCLTNDLSQHCPSRVH